MKKFKIYSNSLLNFKNKYKLKRIIGNIFIPIALVSTITACNKYDESYNNHFDNVKIESEKANDYIYVPSIQKGSIDSCSQNIINSNVIIDDTDLYNINMLNDSIKVDYKYSELFDVDTVSNKYEQITKYQSTSSLIITDNLVDESKLYNIVLKNNDNYIKKNASSNKYTNPSNQDLSKICSIITNSLNYEIKNDDDIDTSILDEKLTDLKVFEYSEFSNGFYSQNDGILGYNPSTINSISSSKNDSNVFEKIIEHESKHIIQANSKNENKLKLYRTRDGVCYNFEDVKVNSLDWNWYFEASAEKKVINQNNQSNPLSYESAIKSLETIKVATILDDDNNINSLENINDQSDLNKLYNYFNCKNKDDIKEIINMFYSYNIILNNNSASSSKDFYSYYKDKYGKKIEGIDDLSFQQELKGSIGITLSKKFYNDLASIIVNKQVDIKDIFALISTYEMELSRETWYSDSTKYENLKTFYIQYNAIQSNFFDALANKLYQSTDNVIRAYYLYNSNYNNEIPSSLLTEEKKSFYNYINKSRENDKRDAISYYYSKIYVNQNKNSK